MPQIFKPLATVCAWALFIAGWLSFIFWLIVIISRASIGAEGESYIPIAQFALGAVCLTLSVVVMKFRQTME